MSFDLRLDDVVKENFDEKGVVGEIEINGEVESFFSPISYWSRSDYYKSWVASLEDAWRRTRPAVFIVSMRDPECAQFMFSWVAYFEGEDVYLQNKIIFNNDLMGKFCIKKINDHFGPRAMCNEDGQRISEWHITKMDITNFFLKIKKNM